MHRGLDLKSGSAELGREAPGNLHWESARTRISSDGFELSDEQ